jgi:hypothetical protein
LRPTFERLCEDYAEWVTLELANTKATLLREIIVMVAVGVGILFVLSFLWFALIATSFGYLIFWSQEFASVQVGLTVLLRGRLDEHFEFNERACNHLYADLVAWMAAPRFTARPELVDRLGSAPQFDASAPARERHRQRAADDVHARGEVSSAVNLVNHVASWLAGHWLPSRRRRPFACKLRSELSSGPAR